jgi:hypothetical protein
MRVERAESDITGLVFHLADLNGEAWASLSQERLAQIENIARLALSAVKGSSHE